MSLQPILHLQVVSPTLCRREQVELIASVGSADAADNAVDLQQEKSATLQNRIEPCARLTLPETLVVFILRGILSDAFYAQSNEMFTAQPIRALYSGDVL